MAPESTKCRKRPKERRRRYLAVRGHHTMKAPLTTVSADRRHGSRRRQEQKKGERKGPARPPANTSVTIDGKTIAIKYSSPSCAAGKSSTAPARSSRQHHWRAAPTRPPRFTPMPSRYRRAWPFQRGLHPVVWLDPQQWKLVVNRGPAVWHGIQPEKDLGACHDHEQAARCH